MASDSFHLTELKGKDGRGYMAGDVVRMKDFGAFNDCVILGFNEQGMVRVSRPYLYASLTGTTGAHPLLGCETFDISLDHIVDFWKWMDNGRAVGCLTW